MDKEFQKEICVEKQRWETLLSNVLERTANIEGLITLKRIKDDPIIDKFKEVREMELSDEKLFELNNIRDILLTMEISDDWDPNNKRFMETCLIFEKVKYEKQDYDEKKFLSAIKYIRMAIQKLHRDARPIVRDAIVIEDKHEQYVTIMAINDLFHQQMQSEMFERVATMNDMKDIKELVAELDKIIELIE